MSAAGPMVRVDLTDPELWQTGVPHDELRRLRREAPVAWASHPGEHRGFWVVSRHADVVEVFRDPSTFSSRGGVMTLDDLEADQLDARRTMLEEDPPAHRALRGLTAHHFTPRAVRAFEGFVRGLAADAVEEVIERGECDLVETLSERVPIPRPGEDSRRARRACRQPRAVWEPDDRHGRPRVRLGSRNM